MKLKNAIKYYILGGSLKEIEMHRILEKIKGKKTITSRERKFMELYTQTSKDDRDFMFLSKNTTYSKIKELMNRNKRIICDLHDKNGKIGFEIIDIKNHIESETCEIIMKNETFELHDKFLYNIIYNLKRDVYSLQEQDEYFEKIEIKND